MDSVDSVLGSRHGDPDSGGHIRHKGEPLDGATGLGQDEGAAVILAVVEVVASNFLHFVPKRRSNTLLGKKMLLYDAEDRTPVLPELITGILE